MNQPGHEIPVATQGLRPRIRALADDAEQALLAAPRPGEVAGPPVAASRAAAPAAAAYAPEPSPYAPKPVADPVAPPDSSPWSLAGLPPSATAPAPPAPAAATEREPVPAPVVAAPHPLFGVSPSALATAPPPTAEPDLEWIHEPAPIESDGVWSLDNEIDEASHQADLNDADRDLVAALQEVLFAKASDLHITVNAPPMIRVDGGLRQIEGTQIWDRLKVTSALLSILNETQREVFESELELDFAYTISTNARFRVNVYQQRGSMGAAFRLIPTEIKQLKDLGVPEAVARFATLARGLVLVTGPTGSGKSTTLAALVDLVNRTRADHIVTVEDPIEFLHTNKKSLVNQREVGPDTHSFAAALKHVLRQDPDVILIGELRDLETISVALTAAETGHLVFATLHTQDAPQTIDRIIDVFPPHQQGQVRAQLAATLQGVVCQTLVKLASGKGRVVATEVLVMTPAVANLIREGKTYQISSALQAGRDLGMYTMDQHLAELVDAGKITHAAAMEKAHDLDGLKRLIQRADPRAGSLTNSMSSTGIDFGDDGSDQGAR